MPTFYPPSHWNPSAVQPTLCDLCQNIRDHDELVESQVKGLQGMWVCRDCQNSGATTLGYEDIVALEGHFEPPVDVLEEPIGNALWYEDPYYQAGRVITDDDSVLITDDGTVVHQD